MVLSAWRDVFRLDRGKIHSKTWAIVISLQEGLELSECLYVLSDTEILQNLELTLSIY